MKSACGNRRAIVRPAPTVDAEPILVAEEISRCRAEFPGATFKPKAASAAAGLLRMTKAKM